MKRVYFCPHCLTFVNNNKGYEYIGDCCDNCYNNKDEEKIFSEEDFKNINPKRKQIFFESNETKMVDIIKDLYLEGKTQKEIIELTYFPRRRVCKTVKKLRADFNTEVLGIKEFCEKYLQISNDEYDYIKEYKCLNHTLNRGMKNAKQFGCSTRCIKKLFGVSERVANNPSVKSLDRWGVVFYHNRIAVKDYKVVVQWLNPEFTEKLESDPSHLYVRYIKNANNKKVINKDCREFKKVELPW